MTNNEETEGFDFFEEVQSKIEKDVFRNADGESESSAYGEGPAGKTGVAKEEVPELSEPDVEVDILDLDLDAVDVGVDDSFLEEIDVLSEEAEDTPQEVGPGVSDGPAFSSTEKEDDFQEDDRYLGELIDREMVSKGSADADDVSESPFILEPSLVQESALPVEEEKTFNTRTLGDLYAEQGHHDKAVQIYENLVQENPEDQGLHSRLEELREKAAGSLEPEPEQVYGEAQTGVKTLQYSRSEVIKRLEGWLVRIHAEKERRCLKSS